MWRRVLVEQLAACLCLPSLTLSRFWLENSNFRRQCEFDKYWTASVQFFGSHGIDVSEQVPGPKRRVSFKVDEHAQTQYFPQTMKYSCRVDIIFSVLDHALRSISDRFSDKYKPSQRNCSIRQWMFWNIFSLLAFTMNPTSQCH